MKAAVFHRPNELRIEDVESPRAGPGEIVVRTVTALTCGTDLKLYRRGHSLAKPPIILGHEFAGLVEELGIGVQGFNRGDRVVSVNSAPCNSCFFCLRGQQNLCERLEEAIIGFTWPGAYAELVRIPANIVSQNTYIIPGRLSFQQAAALEPTSCVIHGSNLAELSAEESVAIIGSGPIGLLHLQVAKARGAKQVYVIGRSERKLDIAKKLGATVAINAAREDQVNAVKKLTDGRGVDVAIEAVGVPEAWEKAILMTRKGGRVLFFGGCAKGTTASIDTHSTHYGELTLKGSFHHTPEAVKQALRLISEGAVQVDPLITAQMSLSEVTRALQSMEAGKEAKVALSFQS